MKIFKKISAIVSSALLVGMTMGVAAAAAYPAPFVQGGSGDVAIVYGTGTGVSPTDVVEASALNLNLNSYVTGTSGSSTVGSSGGDLKILSSSARSLYYGDAINAAYSTVLTKSELPTLLADGTFTDLLGTSYGYSQYVLMSNTSTAFGLGPSGNLGDPKLYINGQYASSTYFNYTLSFAKNLNVSDTANVVGQPITIMGKSFVIGTSSTNTTLYLNGGGQDAVINSGDTATVTTSDGLTHTIKTYAVTATNAATLVVDGVQKSVAEGSTYSFASNLNVYVKDITYQGYAGGVQSVEVLVGSSALKFPNGDYVRKSSSLDAIPGTWVTINAAGNGIISGFTIQVASNSSTGADYIPIGGNFISTVFGAIKLSFVDAVPDLSSSARSQVQFYADSGATISNGFIHLRFTSAKSGEANIPVVYDNTTASTTIQPILAHITTPTTIGKGVIHVLENESAYIGDWIVVNSGDQGTILEVSSIDTTTNPGVSGTVNFNDVLTGTSNVAPTTIYYTAANTWVGSGTIEGGVGYRVVVNNATVAYPKVSVSWNSGGLALFPRIKLSNGGWLALMQETGIANSTLLILPNGKSTLDTTGTGISMTGTGGSTTVNFTSELYGVPWYVLNTSATNINISGIGYPGSTNSGGFCNFSAFNGPAVVLFEPKKSADSSYGSWICLPEANTAGTISAAYMSLGDPVLNSSNSGLKTLGSDQYQSQEVDQYGTFIVKKAPSNGHGDYTMYIPTAQMYFDIALSSAGTTLTPGVSGGNGVSLGSVIVADTGVSGVQQHNLIVVGGSCINSVAANLVGGAYCTSDWASHTNVGSGQFLIQSFGDAYTQGKIALLVAGYDVSDTANAATYLMNKVPDTTSGKKYIGTDASTATLQVSS